MAPAPCPLCRRPIASDRPLERVTCGYHLCRRDLHLTCSVMCHREPKCVGLFCVEHRDEHWCGVREPDRPEEATLSGMEGEVSAEGRRSMEVDETTSSASSNEEGEYRRARVRPYDPTSGGDRNSPYAHPSEKRRRFSYDPTTGSDTNSPFAHAVRCCPLEEEEPVLVWKGELQISKVA